VKNKKASLMLTFIHKLAGFYNTKTHLVVIDYEWVIVKSGVWDDH